MKKGISVLLTGILMISLTACRGDVSQEIPKRYEKLESYTATVSVTVTGNKGESVYRMQQSYRAPDSYRLEVLEPKNLAGTVTVMTGQTLWFQSGDTPAIPMERAGLEESTDFLFPVEFMNSYLAQNADQEITENADGIVRLKAPVLGNSRYRFSRSLEIDATSLLPKKMMTYDQDGNEVLRVEFLDFDFNAELDESVFSP
ncbi:MAG: outer membrane lipoprotein carrier protein LolA [Clostridia bacterium]|nr:outer membrane lipoprotein carrier protein LolA [Clostridia bacterium]